MRALERELELVNAVLLASEGWAKGYAKAPAQHAALIKTAARMQRKILGYLRDVAKDAPRYIDWYAYARAVIEQRQKLQADASLQAYDVNVIINQDALNQQDQTFIKIVFDSVAGAISLGADSMAIEQAGRLPVGLQPTSEIVQQLTTAQLANLVGMKVVDKGLPTEHIIPNPRPAMNIDDTTRGKIARSIKTSITLGEDQPAAARRLTQFIEDADRADMIAYTETVRAYAEGRAEYASQSDAVAKQWQDSDAIDECADNSAQGWISVDDTFQSGDDNEPAHPFCKCIVIYSYDPADLQ